MSQIPLAPAHACVVKPYEHLHIPTQQFAPYDPTAALVYRYRQQVSVNLGSWFVLEDWMTPSLFSCASEPRQAEYDVATGWNGQAAHLMARHWDDWIKEEDFQWLASIGINSVRIPIGYWDLGPEFCLGTPFESVRDIYASVWPRIARAINWAAKYRLGVLMDLHGALGSQNGLSHSGVSGGEQQLFTNRAYQNQTVAALLELTRRLEGVTNVLGIELLNEPSNVENLLDFYRETLATLRNSSSLAAQFPYYISDAYDLERVSAFMIERDDFVVLDHHSYFVFGSDDDQNRPLEVIMSDLWKNGSTATQLQKAAEQSRGNLVIDEWSCALTSSAVGSLADIDIGRSEFCTTQADLYTNVTAGWSFWSYKTENCAEDDNWCFRRAAARSLPSNFATPQPVKSRHAICRLIDCPHDQPSLLHAEQIMPNGGVSLMNAHRLIPRRDSTSTAGCRCAIKNHAEMAIAVGYADGWRVAHSFAGFGGSKLGFLEQFVRDHFTALCGNCPTETKNRYSEWFGRGVKDSMS